MSFKLLPLLYYDVSFLFFSFYFFLYYIVIILNYIPFKINLYFSISRLPILSVSIFCIFLFVVWKNRWTKKKLLFLSGDFLSLSISLDDYSRCFLSLSRARGEAGQTRSIAAPIDVSPRAQNHTPGNTAPAIPSAPNRLKSTRE